MVILKIRIEPEGERLILLPFGDVHYGSKYCNLEVLLGWLEWVKSAKDVRLLLMGDMMDCATAVGSPVGAVYEQDAFVQQQFDTLLNLLEPIKDKIIGGIASNHEQRIFKLSGLDITKILCDRLGITYFGEIAYFDLWIQENKYRVFAIHGSTNAVSRAGKIAPLMRLIGTVDADLYLHGHTHEKDFLEVNMLTLDKTNKETKLEGVYRKKKMLVLTGGFLDYGGYVAVRGLAPTSLGCPKVSLFKDRWDIHVSL